MFLLSRKSISSTPKMPLNAAMANCVFPEDIMVSILTRLPVKPIARFKSVCKRWLELLSSQNFKILHCGEFSRDPKNHSFIHKINENSGNTLSVFKIGHNDPILDHPFSYTHIDMDIIGCCNGLVCLSISKPRNVIHLWNPALKLSKEVLPLEECGPGEKVSIGFGYDAASDDFKVVRIVCERQREGMIVNGVEVYSSNSDSWTRIKVDFLLGVIWFKSSANVNGNPYWFAKAGENVYDWNNVLACFDVTEMAFKIFPLSTLLDRYRDDDDGAGRGIMRLYDYNGRLSVLMFHMESGEAVEHLDVWVFDDSEQVWRTTRRIELDCHYKLQVSKNGDIFWVCLDGKLIVFEPEGGCGRIVFNGGWAFEDLQLCEYTESLAYIEGMKKVKARKRKMIDS